MNFKLRAMDSDAQDQQKPIHHWSTFSSFTKQAIPAGYPNEHSGKLRGRYEMTEAILRELEKERIREEIIAEEVARRRLLEAEGVFCFTVSAVSRFTKIKGIPEDNKKQVIVLGKPNDETVSGTKRKLAPPVSEGSSQRGSYRLKKKVREEWSCAICQVSTTSERGLAEHLKGKKHRAKEVALVAQKTGANFGLGVATTKPVINPSSSLENKSETVKEAVDQTPETNKTSNTSYLNDVKNKENKKDRFKFWCETCQVRAYSETVMNAHKEGRKHLTSLVRLCRKHKVDSEASATANTCDDKPETKTNQEVIVESVAAEVKLVKDDMEYVASKVKPVKDDMGDVSAEDDMEDVASGVKPVKDDMEDVASEVKPVKDDMGDVSAEVKPVKDDMEEVASEVKPVASGVKPIKDDMEDVASEVKPVKDDMEDVASEVKPIKDDMECVAAVVGEENNTMAAGFGVCSELIIDSSGIF
ncbi:hypothetical protein L1987_21053 [Smallanthus sonchifolius]|uniref:Uncharacterized protein n=1 Tax=Smallanthus sonchifolius TaxID=185202 RepID=A0ACB9IWE1_9ASTR|nr:hypothetical protein L1987_21053 [Smallanthus sonchifolius]